MSDIAAPLCFAGRDNQNWVQQDAEAINERRAWIEAHGTPLSDLQVLKIDADLPTDAP